MLWLPISRPENRLDSHVYSFDDLWFREVETGCVPVPKQDRVYLWSEEDDETDGPDLDVKRRYMAPTGRWHVSLATIVIDPTDAQARRITVDAGEGRWHELFPWWTYGDPGKIAEWESKLREAGWIKR